MQAPAGGSTQHGEGGTPAHEYITDTVATEEGHEPPLVRLRFPRNARIYGIPALSDRAGFPNSLSLTPPSRARSHLDRPTGRRVVAQGVGPPHAPPASPCPIWGEQGGPPELVRRAGARRTAQRRLWSGACGDAPKASQRRGSVGALRALPAARAGVAGSGVRGKERKRQPGRAPGRRLGNAAQGARRVPKTCS